MAIGNELNDTPELEPLAADDVDRFVHLAVGGDVSALGELYERCHRYLLLIANQELDDQLRAKFGPSDIVQETLLRAQRHVARFEGRTEAELRAWLRVILLNRVRDVARGFRAGGKRDLARERQLHAVLSEPTDGRLIASGETPSQRAITTERIETLRVALARLPEDYRRAVVLRNLERRPFAEVGQALGRSTEAARKVWLRAVDRLRVLLGAEDESL